jgi:hypothetical protein
VRVYCVPLKRYLAKFTDDVFDQRVDHETQRAEVRMSLELLFE